MSNDEILLRLFRLEEKIDDLLRKAEVANEEESIGDWIPEKVAMRITGLSRSSLYRLRNEGRLTSSSLKTKKVFYRKSDLERLLDKNEAGK